MKKYTATERFFWDETRKKWIPNPSKKINESLIDIVDYFSPKIDGTSEWINISDLQELMPDISAQFGGNGSDMFTRNISKDFISNANSCKIKQRGKVIQRCFIGLTKRDTTITQSIRKDISEKIKKMPCVVLGTNTNTEIDHKDGRKDSIYVDNLSQQDISDFQPLHKTANTVKRERCKKCKETGQRFDAKILGFKVAVIFGSLKYEGTCKGCYWYDPKEWNKEISKNFTS